MKLTDEDTQCLSSLIFVNVSNPAQFMVSCGSFDKLPSKITDSCLAKLELKLKSFIARKMNKKRGTIVVRFSLACFLLFQQQSYYSNVYTELFFIAEGIGMRKDDRKGKRRCGSRVIAIHIDTHENLGSSFPVLIGFKQVS
jgi:hypothetical protein